MIKKERSVYRQTQALLHKNFLRKWRMKKKSVLEWAMVLLPGLALCLLTEFFRAMHFLEQPPQVLGRVDEFNDSDPVLVAYTPVTNVTRSIMDKVAAASYMKGRTILGIPSEDSMDRVDPRNDSEMVGIVFNDTFSYRLKFSWGHRVPIMRENFEYSDHCWALEDEAFCLLSTYWESGFVAFQTAINAAIIEVATNHSVMEELTSVVGINMRTPPFISKGEIVNEWFIFICIIYFSPFVYVASLNITKERKKFKTLMTGMGLRQSAFWLSWALMYAGFVFIASIFMSLVIKLFQMIILTGFMVLVTLFTLYGLSSIALAFLLCVLIERPTLTGVAGALVTVFWGCLGFTALYSPLPPSLGWALCLFSPFAFTAGMAQISHQEYHVSAVVFPDPSGESYTMIVIFFLLAFDTLLYLTLTLYFEHVLPDENGQRHSPLFFLKSSFWSQHKNTHREVFGNEMNSELSCDDSFEPVSPEFHGKEAIRIRNLRKEYKGKPEKVEALQGICLDIYEGQLTAILGHSGAGKSSLLSILSGWSVCTEGSATIYNTQLSEIMNMEEIRNYTGFCPQFNVYFDFLTVRENLRLFAKIKGIPPKEVEQEVKRVIMELDMHNIQDVIAKDFSGGQKRKLTFGIAILGDPQVLLLDEPTAGLDPFSRHLVWNFLKERKTNHTIVFSTQFVDEADILADRKVFLSNGKLRCAGSSLFLKRKWGIGYHLSLHRNERCNAERITSLITQHISDAKLTAESEEKLVYTLPLERTDKFPDLCRDLENSFDQGIMNFGVSMTTLSEVFLNLKGRSAIDEPDPGVGVGGPAEIDMTPDPGVESEAQQALCSLPEVRKTVSSAALWRRQVCAVARLRFLKLRSERKIFLSLLVVFGIALIPTVFEKIMYSVFFHDDRWEFSPGMYFLSLEQLPQTPLTNLLIINNTGSDIEDVVQSLKRQGLVLEVDDAGNRNGSDDPSYNGAVIVSGGHKNYRFSVACNTKRMNCFPVLIGIVSNALLGIFNVTELIKTESSTFPLDGPAWAAGILDFLLLLVVNCLSPYIGMSSASDREQKAQSQLRISGLCPSACWCGQALVDISFYFGILFSIHLMYCIFLEFTIVLEFVFALAVCVAGCAACLILLTYVISLLFPMGRKNNSFWSLSFFLISLFMLILLGLTHSGNIIIICIILIPSCTSIFFLSEMIEQLYQRRSRSQDSERSGIVEIILLTIFIPYLQMIVFLFIIRCLETKYGKETMRKDPFFRISPRRREYRPNPEEPEEEDEDVQAERVKTANALTASTLAEKPVIMASCLHKKYKQKKKRCFSARKTKTAVRNVSFCINKGEVLGLLGHNGAGKSTSIKMITGDTKPTAGVVVFSGSGTAQTQQADDGFGRLGYCPQEDALWPDLTVREHLDLYAAVKGLAKEEAVLSVSRLADALKLQDQMALPAKALPEGAKRTLSFALSILGSPAVLLLDEPTTGLDPEGQLRMWQAIQAIVKNTARSALLTTHSMAEAEAVCDRVAVMVSGRLRCIGSVQHLKSKYGKDYLLEVKVKALTRVEPLHMEILKLFPQAARQERYSFVMAYKLPVEDVHPLSQTFSKLEAVKQTFDLEEYSLSQATLEQVFLELSKEQEPGNLDDDIDTTVRWKLLPQEES